MSPITNLQGVQQWLGTLSVGGSVSVSSSLFNAPRVNALFTLIPGLDPVALQITAIDTAAATLTGTAAILDEPGCTATLVFTQPAQDLLCTLTVALPASVQWTLLDKFAVAFGNLVATFTPNPDLNVIAMSFSANLLAGSNPGVIVPITLSVPSFSGDWILSGSFPGIGSLTTEALQALAGNNDLLSILAPELQQIQNFQLTAFEMQFNPSQKTCALIGATITYNATPPWQFFGGLFTILKLAFDFQVLTPFSGASLNAKILAEMMIGTTTIDVGGIFPDNVVFAQLAPGTVLKLSDTFSFFHVPLPSGFPDIEISTLSFNLYVASSALDFQLAITKPVPILGTVSLDNFFFNISGSYDSAKKQITAQGQLSSQFTVGPTRIALSGSYAQASGFDITGVVTNVPVGDLIGKIANEFSVQLPAPIANLKLTKLSVEVNTGQKAFHFACEGTTTVANVEVTFSPTIDLNWGGTVFTGVFGGTLVLHTSDKRDITFGLTFSKTSTDTTITATYQDTGQGLEFQDIASAFKFDIPPIPPDLDLALTAAGFTYNFNGGSLAFGAQSKNYGTVAFATTTQFDSTRQFFFLLGVNKQFSLSNLPLVGSELAKIENISVGNILVAISSMPSITATQAGDINTLINTFGKGYPNFPGAVSGKFLLMAELDFGTQKIPLNLTLGAPGQAAPAPALLAGAPGAGSTQVAPNVAGGAVSTSGSANGTVWFTVQKSFGPVSIQRIGALYQFKQQTLWFELDATLTFGPMTVELVGLGIGSPIKSFSPQFSLQGLGLAYTNPPVEIAGSLVNLAPPGADYIEFEGGVTIGTGDFTLMAFGFYGNQNNFTSLFIFGSLAYDFGGPPAFFVTGVALGFGYNSNLRLPTIDEVATFPFVQVLPTSTVPNTGLFGPNPTPQKVLDVILNTQPPWVTALQGSLWFAAGITFTSFELVNSQALVVVQIGPQLVIALIGTSRAQFPQAVPGAKLPVYAYIELDLELEIAPILGVFSLQAVLAPSSFLLDKACVLTGGFAFFVWFGNNPHAGDFVLSLGGYNPGFTPPSYYPSVPRVGFHWSLDSSITISGGAYFAFTPSALMVGGALSATYQSGNLKAWFDVHADIIVQWKPFWFDADFGLTVGASYKVDLLFTSFTVSVELGCSLEFWGPPTGGTVGVDWYIISFTIPFGTSKSDAQPKLSGWGDVQTMLPNTGTPQAPNVLTLAPASGLSPATTSPSNSSPSPQLVGDSAPAPWIVRGSQFGFSTSSSVPASSASVGAAYAFNGGQFNVAPLNWTGVGATHAITIVDSANKDVSAAFSAAPAQRSLPSQLWGRQQSSTPTGDNQLVPNQLVGVSLLVNPPDVGGSAGPVNVAVNLSNINLNLPNALIGISGSAQPVGDTPVNSQTTIAQIADPQKGIASTTVTGARNAIFTALQSAGYAPPTANDAMTNFASQIGCALATEPLLVS